MRNSQWWISTNLFLKKSVFSVLVMDKEEWSSKMLKIVQSLNSFHHKGTYLIYYWVVPENSKDPHSPHGGNFCHPEGEGKENCF
jgi:hypothetical protein